MSCGGSFWSSWRTDFHSALSFALHFFTSLDFPLERCVCKSTRNWKAGEASQSLQIFTSRNSKNAHCSDSNVRTVKKCRTKLKALWERSHQELRNEPPHDIAHPLPQNPFLASLIQTRSRGWPERDFGVMGELCHVGARFEALDESVLAGDRKFSGRKFSLWKFILWKFSGRKFSVWKI